MKGDWVVLIRDYVSWSLSKWFIAHVRIKTIVYVVLRCYFQV